MNQPLDNISFDTYTDKKGLELAISMLGPAEYSESTTFNKLVERGYTESQANSLIEQAKRELAKADLSKAKRNVVVGAAFLVGGTILTLANIGFIFWGAIVFGGIQMVQGIIQLSAEKNKLNF